MTPRLPGPTGPRAPHEGAALSPWVAMLRPSPAHPTTGAAREATAWLTGPWVAETLPLRHLGTGSRLPSFQVLAVGLSSDG